MSLDECEHENLYFDRVRGEKTCTDCGLVVSQNCLNYEAIQNNIKLVIGVLNPKHIQNTTSQPMWRSPDPFYCTLGSSFLINDVTNGELNPRWRQRQDKLHLLQQKEKESHTTFNHKIELRTLCTLLELPNPIYERAIFFYEKYGGILLNEHKGYYAIAVCLMVACRERQINIPIERVCDLFRMRNRKVIRRQLFQMFSFLLGIIKPSTKNRIMVKHSEDYLNGLLNELQQHIPNLNKQEVVREAQRILQTIPNIERGGRNPRVFTLAVIYTVGKLLADKKYNITQNLLSQTFGVSDYTLRTHWRFIASKLNL